MEGDLNDFMVGDQGRRKVEIRSPMVNDTRRSRSIRTNIDSWVCLYQSLMGIVMLTKVVCEVYIFFVMEDTKDHRGGDFILANFLFSCW